MKTLKSMCVDTVLSIMNSADVAEKDAEIKKAVETKDLAYFKSAVEKRVHRNLSSTESGFAEEVFKEVLACLTDIEGGAQ